jgi:hypothetical protein
MTAPSLSEPVASVLASWLKPLAIVFGSILIACAIIFIGIILVMATFFAVTSPSQPKFGFTGPWRSFSVFGVEERVLPPAKDIWKDYAAWKPRTNEHGDRVYLARLGGAERQSRFEASMSSGDTPMGAQQYTNAEFLYTDPTNGTYFLTWTLRGKHNTKFLRFDGTYRLFQLRPYGETNEFPPRLEIVAIEGIKPFEP